MGGFTGLFSSSQGAGFQAQDSSNTDNIYRPTTTADATAALGTANNALAQQNAFTQALQAQNGIQNQSNVYSQLQGIANGTGPNPAMAQLQNTTGQNVANQAALMAGQRGTGSNAGLIARQAAQQGAATQQQAVGQGAALQAQQQLGAINAAGNIAGQQVSNLAGANQAYTQGTQNEQQNILNSIAQQNQAIVGLNTSANSANSSIAGVNAGAQDKAVSGLFNGAGAAIGMAKGGMVPAQKPQHFADGGMPSFSLGVAPLAPASPITAGSGWDSLYSGQSSGQPQAAASSAVPKMASNTPTNTTTAGAPQSSSAMAKNYSQDPSAQAGYTAGNMLGKGVKSLFSSSNSTPNPMDTTSTGIASNSSAAADAPALSGLGSADELGAFMAANGGKVPAMLSPGEVYLDPKAAKMAAKGKADPIKSGKKVPGKAAVKGNSLKNDTVPANLSPGGVVIPKSVMESKNPHEEAYKFVNAVLAKNGMRKSK